MNPTRATATANASGATALYLLDLIGVAVFALSGTLAASHAGMDMLGGVALAAITAIGGGTLRDVLLNRHPIFWVRDARYLSVILAAALLTMAWDAFLPPPGNTLLMADALGLALCAISGAQVAEALGHPRIVIVLMGTMTGVAGGMLRDMMSAQVPLIFRKDIYASAAIAGIVIYLLLQALGMRRAWAVGVGAAIILGLRLGAVLWGWHLPQLHLAA